MSITARSLLTCKHVLLSTVHNKTRLGQNLAHIFIPHLKLVWTSQSNLISIVSSSPMFPFLCLLFLQVMVYLFFNKKYQPLKRYLLLHFLIKLVLASIYVLNYICGITLSIKTIIFSLVNICRILYKNKNKNLWLVFDE